VGFFYYSGHGASARIGSRRHNFLIPSGSSIANADELVTDGVPLETIIGLLENTGAKAVFVVFDACRSELPWSKGGADPDKGFDTVAARPGLFIAFSTDAGATSPDDGAFSAALAEQLVKPNVPHLLAFDEAALIVGRTRGTDRLPWYSNQIRERIFFVGDSNTPTQPPEPRPNPQQPPTYAGTAPASSMPPASSRAPSNNSAPVGTAPPLGSRCAILDGIVRGTSGSRVVPRPTGIDTQAAGSCPVREVGRGYSLEAQSCQVALEAQICSGSRPPRCVSITNNDYLSTDPINCVLDPNLNAWY
jgi:hypothetical protein